MYNLKDDYSELAELTEIPKEVFIGNDKFDQALCDFILTISVMYNDLKDYHTFLEFVQASKPGGDRRVQKQWGEFSGISLLIDRFYIATLREYIKFFYKHRGIVNGKFVTTAFKQANKTLKDHWVVVKGVTQGDLKSNSFLKRLKDIRDNVGFHYNSESIREGLFMHEVYKNPSQDLLASIGNRMKATRYYFADVAAQGYIFNSSSDSEYIQLGKEISVLTSCLNQVLHYLICYFLSKRGVQPK